MKAKKQSHRVAPMVKRSVTLATDLDEEAHALVGQRGFSALVNEGLHRAIQARRVAGLIEEYESAHGSISDSEASEALRSARERAR